MNPVYIVTILNREGAPRNMFYFSNEEKGAEFVELLLEKGISKWKVLTNVAAIDIPLNDLIPDVFQDF